MRKLDPNANSGSNLAQDHPDDDKDKSSANSPAAWALHVRIPPSSSHVAQHRSTGAVSSLPKNRKCGDLASWLGLLPGCPTGTGTPSFA